MEIVFFGTPDFAAQVLTYLLEEHVKVVAVVTQPDRPKGRALQLTASAVKSCVLNHGLNIPILQPEKSSDPSFLKKLSEMQADLYVVVAFGQILPQSLLDIPPKGCINIHSRSSLFLCFSLQLVLLHLQQLLRTGCLRKISTNPLR